MPAQPYPARFLRVSMAVCLGIVTLVPWVIGAPSGSKALTDEQKVRHVLNRIGFGARPGDHERVRRIGVRAFIDEQLHPERIDDSAVDAKLARLETLTLSSGQLARALRESRAALPGSTQPDPAARRAYQAFTLRAVNDLQTAKVLRAVESRRQLEEVMVDFWTNHFNIDIRKGINRPAKLVDDREVIRKHALGRFRDLLGASAHSPSMLVYLDNARNFAPPPARPGRRPAANRGGINENYARELMELHTLGVEGGYTQSDVQEVARCLTGWSVDPATGEFRFYAARHDNGEKTVLGRSITAGGGESDGEAVLDLLAAHPSTARHIARKLCQRFIADDPPQSVVDRAASAFRRTDGDIRETVRAILTSKEFTSPAAYRGKVKSPFEFVVSAVRAMDGELNLGREPSTNLRRTGPGTGARALAAQIARMGEPLFACQAPTGYPEDSGEWLNAGGLVMRMDFALALAADGLPGVIIPETAPGLPEGPAAKDAIGAAAESILGGELSGSTRDTLVRANLAPEGLEPKMLTAYLLGSPDFQRR